MEFFDHLWLHFIINLAIVDVINIWSLFNDYIYLQILLIASVFYFFAKVFSRFIPNILNSLADKFEFEFGKKLAKLLEFPIFYLTFFLGLMFTTYLLDINESTQNTILSIIESLIIIVSSKSIFSILSALLQYKAEHSKVKGFIQISMLPLLKNTLLISMSILTIHQVFAVWGIDMAAILAAAGIAGLAIAMASKDVLTDVIAGTLIMTDQPYSIGEIIELDSGLRGMVMAIGLRSTRIVTKDNIELIIPNSSMGSSKIINESSSKKEGIRFKLLISAAAGVEVDYIRPMLMDILNQQESLMTEYTNKVILSDFNNQMITFCLEFWVKDPLLRTSVPAKIREDIYRKFLQENVPLASPMEREIVIKSLPNLFGHNEPRQIK